MEYFETLGSGIRIRHPDGCFRMSTDSMLAADFLPLGPRDRVADLGCGSGNLAFLLAGREPEVRITGFELQTAAVQAAQLALAGDWAGALEPFLLSLLWSGLLLGLTVWLFHRRVSAPA